MCVCVSMFFVRHVCPLFVSTACVFPVFVLVCSPYQVLCKGVPGVYVWCFPGVADTLALSMGIRDRIQHDPSIPEVSFE